MWVWMIRLWKVEIFSMRGIMVVRRKARGRRKKKGICLNRWQSFCNFVISDQKMLYLQVNSGMI